MRWSQIATTSPKSLEQVRKLSKTLSQTMSVVEWLVSLLYEPK